MSNKFLKILGICVMVIMLPVLIAVSAVSLSVKDASTGNSGQNDQIKDPIDDPVKEPDVISYTIHSDYAKEATLTYNDETSKWEIDALPTRDYYDFVGVRVDAVNYIVTDKTVVFSDDNQKTAFKTAVEANKPITAVWDCIYSEVYLGAELIWAEYGQCGYTRNYFDPDAVALEYQGVFTLMNYNFEDNDPITSVKVQDLNNHDTIVTIQISDEDRTINNGKDISFKTLLDKIAEQNFELVATADKSCLELSLIGK